MHSCMQLQAFQDQNKTRISERILPVQYLVTCRACGCRPCVSDMHTEHAADAQQVEHAILSARTCVIADISVTLSTERKALSRVP